MRFLSVYAQETTFSIHWSASRVTNLINTTLVVMNIFTFHPAFFMFIIFTCISRSRLKWETDFHTPMDCDFRTGKFNWFLGGKLNISVNCVDRSVRVFNIRGYRIRMSSLKISLINRLSFSNYGLINMENN